MLSAQTLVAGAPTFCLHGQLIVGTFFSLFENTLQHDMAHVRPGPAPCYAATGV